MQHVHSDDMALRLSGHCVLLRGEYFEKDGVAIDPSAFTVVVAKFYLNYNGTVRALWVLDIQGYVKRADQNWPEIRNSTQIFQ